MKQPKRKRGKKGARPSPQRAKAKFVEDYEFQSNCLALLDEVASTGKHVVVIRHGKALVELRPHKPARGLIGVFKDDIEITGDIISPIDVEWDAMK
jgi:hypothetical protein